MRRAGAVIATSITVVVLGLVLGPPLAGATNWVGTTAATGCASVNRQDNRDYTFTRSSLTARMASAVAFVNNNLIGPTDVTVKPEQFTATSETDVVVFDADYSTTCGYDWHPDSSGDPDTDAIAGLMTCETLSGSRCQQAYVRFDTSLTNAMDDAFARTLACHELGHTLGLGHRENPATDKGCMPSLLPANQPNYSAHDRAHIQDNY
jgi:hypothetical protein